MLVKKLALGVVACLVLSSATPTLAHDDASAAALKAEVLRSIEDAETKLLALVEAVPQEKYGWAPSKEVRTMSQVFMHVAGGNYFLAGLIGAPPEGGRPSELEKITDRAAVKAALKKSFDYTRANLAVLPAADYSAEVDAPWGKARKLSLMIGLATHAHEHLGQAIAYVRSIGVVPPWSKSE